VPNSWPWMVSLLKWYGGNSFSGVFCGASIISSRYILTAAHCVDWLLLSELVVYVEAHESVLKNDSLIAENLYFAEEVKIHPEWDTNRLRNDVALIKLNRNIAFSRTVSPICLPPSSDSTVVYNKKLVLTGWGDDELKDYPQVLQQAVLTVINGDKSCKYYDINSNYCAIGNTTAIGAIDCFGDSGGPLQFYNNAKWSVYGLVSYGPAYKNGMCKNFVPSYYANVPFFLSWIKSNAV